MEPPAAIPLTNEHENVGETQGATQQASQYASYYANSVHPMESPFFGCFQPCNTALRRLDFQKTHPHNAIGRGPGNDFVLHGMRISYNHCQIMWDGREDRHSQVVVHDNSTNGTWINGTRVQKGESRILRDGNEIAFGSPMPQQNVFEDYRYIYRHLAPLELTGIHAHYDMAHELGKGSFATVMKAMARETGEWWAVKIIHGNKVHSGNNHTLQAFGREISILETLDHPNICRLRETFVPDDGGGHDFYLVLELVEGGDLLDYILRNDGLSEPLSQHITRQICNALSYIHAKGITHRDLKPENVLLTKDDPPNVKVADFGLAKVVDSLTMLKTMCGTPSYLAPEVVNQTEENRGYDQLVDSWSVGVIVFSMLTNTGPFIEDENEHDMRRRIAERYIDWDTLRQKGVSAPAQDFIRRLLNTNPSTRMTLTDALHHPWLEPSSHPAGANPNTTPSTDVPPASTTAAPHNPVGRNLSDLSELSELSDGNAEIDAQQVLEGDVSMLSAGQSVDDMPGVQALNIGSPARSRVRAPLERRSQVLARELAAEAEAAAASSPTTTKAHNGGGKRPRSGSRGPDGGNAGISPDDFAMGEGGASGSGADSDEVGVGGGGSGEHGGAEKRPRAAKRGKRSGGKSPKDSPPPPGVGNGTGRTLRPRNGAAASAGGGGGARR
ncbi:kinase-like domain-containing protein [Multifurca ochricompacta]|uniref:Kinase-like domain-containing protein n=1 Tax=Multifurca ochricompacta TaxID=376703 RepID=A0AAD4M613_9AGAM|nr:kinase-like domain-containing protein [Multifurca ochricompacta]